MSRRVALIGASGQLGSDLRPAWAAAHPGDEIAALTHADIEVTDAGSIRRALDPVRPHVVINTAAYHKVDEVEDRPDRAFAVNAVAARQLALVCRDLDAVLVHLSTDYVFPGDATTPYTEDDGVGPINVYGASKAAGEMLIRAAWPRHVIVRSSGLYGLAGSSGKGGNFVELMLRLAREGRAIRVVDDQTLTPTATHALARQIVALCDVGVYGTYHATCRGQCSWYAFSAEIFRLAALAPALSPQTTAESGARARRPAYSVLENRALSRLGLDRMPGWQTALAEYLAARGADI